MDVEIPDFTDSAAREEAIDRAFDYRGNVTLRKRGGEELVGYLYDRRSGEKGRYVKVMLREGGEAQIDYDDIVGLALTGRDMAAGKSWEAWLKRAGSEWGKSTDETWEV